MSENFPPLELKRVAAVLRTSPIGHQIHYRPSVDSTNLLARQLDLPHGAVVMADYQAAGRGRRGRSWRAPANTSLLLSIVLHTPGVSAGDVMMAVALSVADAIASETGLPVDLKWPNDIVVRGRKLCGILAEHDTGSGNIVIGIGVNVNFIPDAADPITANATSVLRELGQPVDRESLALTLFTRLNLWYRMLTERADAVYDAWVARLAVVGKSLEVHDSSGIWCGTAVGVQRDGALRVRADRGEVRALYAADVSVRPANVSHLPDREVD